MKGTTQFSIGLMLLALAFLEVSVYESILTHPYMVLLVGLLTMIGGFNLGIGMFKMINGK